MVTGNVGCQGSLSVADKWVGLRDESILDAAGLEERDARHITPGCPGLPEGERAGLGPLASLGVDDCSLQQGTLRHRGRLGDLRASDRHIHGPRAHADSGDDHHDGRADVEELSG